MNSEPTNLRAEKLWRSLSKDTQEGILNAVWCSTCRKGTPIEEWKLGVKEDAVVMEGKCSICNGDCVRLVEEF